MMDKVKLLETSGNLYSFYYTLGDTIELLLWQPAAQHRIHPLVRYSEIL